jgi:hypothetical protein
MLNFLAGKVWWLITTALSESGEISFGRTISAVITLYFLGQDAWFFHRTGHLIDNATLLTQLSVMTAFYASSKGLGIFSKDKPVDKQP